jgi:predicted TIM-barrel fold metal-dependent hydrolase
MHTRREFAVAFAPGLGLYGQTSRPSPVVETHLHLFSPDEKGFPFHPNAVYKPKPLPLYKYVEFLDKSKIDHTVIVHPEPYQDDHRLLEYCFDHEPSKGFFKGTCLFDALDPKAPARMKQLMSYNPNRIVAVRVHATADPKDYPAKGGPIRDRDLESKEMKRLCKGAADLGLALQFHIIPYYAPMVRKLAAEFSATPVIIDHFARAGFGTPEQYEEVLRMSELPRVYMKFSGVRYSSKQPFPHLDAKPLVEKTFRAFGADRMIWGGLGSNMADYRLAQDLINTLLGFASEQDRAKVKGLTAMKLFRFASAG